MFRDLRYALRVLTKSPGFTLAVILTLALGIAATTAAFSVFDAILLRPFSWHEPDRLVRVFSADRNRKTDASWTSTISYPDLVDTVSQSSAFSTATYSVTWNPPISGNGEAEILTGAAVDSHFFETFGVQPEHGRFFSAREDQSGFDDKIVLSHSLWLRKFGGQDVVGKALRIDGRILTVIGVAPATFEDPRINQPHDCDLWTSLAPLPSDWSRTARSMAGVARLREGVSLSNARARVASVAARLRQQYPAEDGHEDIDIASLNELVVGNVRRPLALLLLSASLLLLIACANVVNLILARTSRRAGEISVRIALGASPWHLLRYLLAEVLVLAAMGGGAGLLLAIGAIRLLQQIGGASVPRLRGIELDRGVLLFAILVTLAATVVTTILPALRAIRGSIAAPGTVRGASASAGVQRAQAALVVAQMAISVVVIAVAALLGRSLWNLFSIDKGFNASGVLTMQVRAPREDYPKPAAFDGFYHDAIDRLAALPGVTFAGDTSILPYDGDWSCDSYTIGVADANREPACAETRVISSDYLAAIGASLVRGRGFSPRDDANASSVAVIDQELARRNFGAADAVGQPINIHGKERTIVGVVTAARLLNVDEIPNPAIYLPEAQDSRAGRQRWIVIRTKVDPRSLASAARKVIASLSPNAPVMNVRSMGQVIGASLQAQRFRAICVGSFALVALLLAAVGLASVLAFATTQRTREIGIRLACGATPSRIARLVLRRALQLLGSGALLGVGGALLAGRFVKSLLFGVPAADPLTLGAALALLACAGVIAALWPALRAALVQPVEVLRAE